MVDSFIEDETDLGYIVRTDLMKDGEEIQCKDDADMHIKKERNVIVLIKKSFRNDCFSK